MTLLPQDIIRYLLRTEKSTQIQPQNKYVFAVEKKANKIQIKKAIEKLYNVRVRAVNTVILHGKWRRVGRSEGRRPDWKKAIVTLKEGDKIEVG